MVAAGAGSAAAILAALPVLLGGTAWTWQAPSIVAPLGGISVSLDRLGAFFLALIGITGLPASAYGLAYQASLDVTPRGRLIHAMVNLFLLGMCLVPAADNVITLLLSWELMALGSYVLVVSDPAAAEGPPAGAWYAVMTHAGFLALMLALLMAAGDGPTSFEAIRLRAAQLDSNTLAWVTGLTLLAGGSKAGLMPLHVWLPRAHPAAPSHVSALMSAAMVKLGVYLLIRMTFDLLPPGPAWWGGVLLTLGVATALGGVLYAVTESHIKRVLAYSTIENVGLLCVALGFALLMRGYGYPELAAMGVVVCLLHALNHSVFKTLLFLGAGAVVHGVGSAALEAYGGLIRRMPWTAAVMLVGVLGLTALPPLNGFPSEWLTFQLLVAGARHTTPELAIVLPLALAGVALSAGLAAVAGVRLFGMTFLALPRSDEAARAHEPARLMVGAMLLPAAGCILLGLLPTAVLPVLTSAAADLGLPGSPIGAAASVSLPMVGSQLWPAALAVALGGGVLFIALVLRIRRGSAAVRTAGVWNCGSVGQSPRSEYTAASYAEPLRRVFTGFYRPTHEVTVESHSASQYFVRSVTYRSHVAPWIESRLYSPLLTLVGRASRLAGRLQSGSIHFYLALLPAALLLLLFLSTWIVP
jgi:formate hydrogenlyase subunit 3/multisubunit Na+/H+ antiporter MnhD subunit